MKNFQELIDKAISICDSVNDKVGYTAIDYYKDIKWEVSNRLKRCWGKTTIKMLPTVTGNTITGCRIKISDLLLADNLSDAAALNTIIHEILHTCPNGNSHTGKWKKMADLINKYYPEYCIKKSTTYNEKGIESNRKPKYVFKCTSCGQIVNYYRNCNFVKYTSNYRCGICKGGVFEKI